MSKKKKETNKYYFFPYFQRSQREQEKTNQPNNDIEKVEIKPTTLNSMSISPRPSTSSASSNAKRSLEKSQDIFASSPESENSKTTSPKAIVNLTISDDSETDELLVAVSREACEKMTPKKQVDKVASSSPAAAAPSQEQKRHSNGSSSSSPAAKPRQRTLLEMLDQTYNQAGPATKKYCTSSKSPQQKK